MSVKVLKSQYHGGTWKSTTKAYRPFPVETLAIEDLWASVPQCHTLYKKPFFENLKNDISADGLHFPLLVVHAKLSDLIAAKKRYKEAMCELPFNPDDVDRNSRMYVIWGGSQRVRAAQELGYTHIDCAIIPTLEIAKSLQLDMRKPYRDRYYR